MKKAAILLYREMQKKMEKDRMKNNRGMLFTEGLKAVLDINYRGDGDVRHTLDVFSPEGGGRLPVIIEIHGGGYIGCEKNINRVHARWFAQQGFHVVNGDYTLIPEGDFGTILQEIADIVGWVEANADAYGFDTDRVYLSGDSAGGHIVLLYAMLRGNEKLREYFGTKLSALDIKAVAPTCPAFRFDRGTGKDKNGSLDLLYRLIFPKGADPVLLDMLDVTKLIFQGGCPPLYITATPGDSILYAEDLILEKALDESGGEYVFKAYESRGNKLEHVFNVLYPEYEESIEANTDIIDFFLKH